MIFSILKIFLLISLTSCLFNTKGMRVNGNLDNTNRDVDIIDSNLDQKPTPTPKIQLLHIIDPYNGNYKKKITIHKGFSGTLLIAGLNLSQLKDKEGVAIRLRLGKDLAPIILPAVIAPTFIPGLTATTPMDAIQVDFDEKPLRNWRLNYQLYDYNQYATDENPIADPFNNQLFCRALSNRYDPTFIGNSNSSKCSLENDRCLYSYANVIDQGLYVNNFPIMPIELQFAFNKTGLYSNETNLDRSKKCLADNADDTYTLGANFPIPATNSPGLTIFNIEGTNYTYRGPYQARNMEQWEITGKAVTGRDNEGNFWGLFERLAHPLDFQTGFYSLKFPRAGMLPVKANREYIGANTSPKVTSHGSRRPHLPTQDLEESLPMDGCNLRISRDQISQDGLDSCDVTALIEIVKKDEDTGTYRIVENVSEVDLKIQVIYNTTKTPLNESELISTNFRTCQSNAACGSNECCYNNRCWSKNIITQCIENSPEAQLTNGSKCSYDADCKSLCCSPNTGTCQAHDGKQTLCSKPLGSSCIASEFCSKVLQTQYIIQKIIDPQTLEETCVQNQRNVYVFADCILSGARGICQKPPDPRPPDFDPKDPKCDE